MNTCPRCRYYEWRLVWPGMTRASVWLQERPAHLGGAWALGCRCCAAHDRMPLGKQHGTQGTLWGASRVALQPASAKRHEESELHTNARANLLSVWRIICDDPRLLCAADRDDDDASEAGSPGRSAGNYRRRSPAHPTGATERAGSWNNMSEHRTMGVPAADAPRRVVFQSLPWMATGQ